jgi:hypothetical protein
MEHVLWSDKRMFFEMLASQQGQSRGLFLFVQKSSAIPTQCRPNLI